MNTLKNSMYYFSNVLNEKVYCNYLGIMSNIIKISCEGKEFILLIKDVEVSD